MNEMIEKEYLKDLEDIKNTINENRNKAMVVVNSAMIMTYYKIGTIINNKKVWGNKYIQRLANDLKNYGNGYSYTHLKKCQNLLQFLNQMKLANSLFSKFLGERL